MQLRKLSLVIIMMGILLFTPNGYTSYYQSWKEIEKWAGWINASATTIKIEFESHYRNEYLSTDQFELYENVVYIWIYLLDSTSNISIEKLVIISPSGYKREIHMIKETTWHFKKTILYRPLSSELHPGNPLIFNETGIWTIEIQTNSSTFICEYKGKIQDFNENSKVKNFYGNRKGIEVLSPSAVQQLATAIETKNLVEWQKKMVIFTAAMAGFTAAMVFVTAIDIIKKRKKKDLK